MHKSLVWPAAVNAGPNIGIGHLQRCLNLAEFLKNKHKVTFIFCDTPKLILKEIKKNFKIIVFKDNKNILNNAKKFFNKEDHNYLILDDYSVNYHWEKSISYYFSKVLVIGDHLDRKHHCDFYLNQNIIDSKSQEYISKKFSNTKCLLGPKYALLDKRYLKYSRKEKIRDSLKNIIKTTNVFTSGGLNSSNISDLIKNFKPFAIDVSSGVETEGEKDPIKIKDFLVKANLT